MDHSGNLSEAISEVLKNISPEYSVSYDGLAYVEDRFLHDALVSTLHKSNP
jgi:hypothetical protein